MANKLIAKLNAQKAKEQKPAYTKESAKLVTEVTKLVDAALSSMDFRLLLENAFFLRMMAVVESYLIWKKKSVSKDRKKPIDQHATNQMFFILGYLAARAEWWATLEKDPELAEQMKLVEAPAVDPQA
jgi:hypothetical protein